MKDRKADKNIVGAMVVGLYETIVNSNWENETDDKNDNMEMEQYNKIAEASYRLADAAEEALFDVRSMEEKASGVSIEDISLISDSLKENGEKKLKQAIKHVKGLDKDVLEVKDHTVILQREMKRAKKAANDAGGAVAGIVSKLLEARVGITRSIENLGIAADSDEAYRKFSTALANATGAYSHASDGKEIYDEALSLYEKAGKAGERAKKELDDAFEKLSFDASSACADIVSVKNNLDRLRETTDKEQLYVDVLTGLENKRRSTMGNIATVINKSKADIKITDIISFLDGQTEFQEPLMIINEKHTGMNH